MSHENENQNLSESDNLDWLAFCYVADELSETDRNQFEARLEEDHEAREAVVTAMQQAELIWLACDDSSANSLPIQRTQRNVSKDTSRHRSSRATALATGAAALLLMVLGWGWYVNQDNNNNAAISESENLAVVLAELVEEESDAELEPEFVDFEIEDGDSSFAEDEMSDWMFVALVDEESEFEGAE